MQTGVPPTTSSALRQKQRNQTHKSSTATPGKTNKPPTFVFKLELSDLAVFLLDPQNQTRTWAMSCNLVECVDFFLVLRREPHHCLSSFITVHHSHHRFTCFMASTRLLSDVVCSINISAALSWLRSLSTSDLASAKTFSKEQFIPEEIDIYIHKNLK